MRFVNAVISAFLAVLAGGSLAGSAYASESQHHGPSAPDGGEYLGANGNSQNNVSFEIGAGTPESRFNFEP